MNHVLQGIAIYDSIQLVNANNVPVDGLLVGALVVTIRKEGDPGFSPKTLGVGDFVDDSSVTPGMYRIKFSDTELNTLGIFRYRVQPAVPLTFQNYEDLLHVITAIPVFPEQDPPTINAQTASPVGITPDPVAHNGTLTINGTNLDNATSVKIGAVSLAITANTSGQITATVGPSVVLGAGQVVEVITPGGVATAEVEVNIDVASIPGSGLIALTGQVWSNKTALPAGVGEAVAFGRILDIPNLAMGVGWSDEERSASTNSNGEFSLTLPRNVRVRVRIPYMRYDRVFTTPNLATANIFTEIPNT